MTGQSEQPTVSELAAQIAESKDREWLAQQLQDSRKGVQEAADKRLAQLDKLETQAQPGIECVVLKPFPHGNRSLRPLEVTRKGRHQQVREADRVVLPPDFYEAYRAKGVVIKAADYDRAGDFAGRGGKA